MMRMKAKTKGFLNPGGAAAAPAPPPAPLPAEWEVRPGGMLVQRRSAADGSDRSAAVAPTIRVRVKYGSTYHEINMSSQATFGELKKKLTGPTGLHHEDQKLLFKDKERSSNAYLDISGVKDRSKMVLMEDPISQEKRFLEMRRTAKMERASKSISEISLEVDKLAAQVAALDSVVSKGGKVAETEVLNLIELLMNQLLKLDGIMADGDVKLQRKMQVRRVQKYVETLDMVKVKNSQPSSNGGGGLNPINHQRKYSNGQGASPVQPRNSVASLPAQMQQLQLHQQEQQPSRHSTASSGSSGPVVVTTQWEIFDSAPALAPAPVPPPSSSSSSANISSAPAKFNWEFFE